MRASVSNVSLFKKTQPSLFAGKKGFPAQEDLVFVIPKNAAEVYSASEAAKYLKITMRTLKNYRYEGLIEYIQYNSRKIVYTKHQLDAFLKSRVKRFELI